MICGGQVICDVDKFAKKDALFVNVVNASSAGVCKEFHQFNHIINFTHFEYAVKIKFSQNGVTPARKVAVIPFDIGLQIYDDLVEYEVALIDAPDDGTDS
jgi:hypothetical protein